MLNLQEMSEYDQLRETIKKKDKVAIRNLILNNYTVNIPNSKGASPLHWAIIKFKDLEIITMLLDKGADVHARNHNNEKPLDVAIKKNRTQAAILLIEKEALVGEDINVLLLEAIEKNNHIIFKILIDHSTQDNQSINFKKLFNVALSQGHAKILEHILPHYQPTEKYISKELIMTPASQYKDCVELLLKWNFIIGFPNSNRNEEFVYAAVKNGHLLIVLQLLKLGINVNLENSNTGLSLLKIACLNKHHEIVENLLQHNACLNVTTPNNTKMSKRRYNHNVHEYNHSLSSIRNKNNIRGMTCLHIAVRNSDPIMTELLLRYGAKIENDPKFFNITCMAIRKSCEEIVRIFLNRGVDVNGIDSEGKTLLHYCVYCCSQDSRYKIAKLLLENGAIIHIQTPNNSLIFEAVKSRHRKIAQLFLDNNADIQYTSPDGNTLLHKAIEKNFDIKFIKTLLKLNLPVHAVNNKMYTPLLVACKTKSNNQFQVIKTLLHYNVDVNYVIFSLEPEVNLNATQDEGQTPLHFACKHKSELTTNIIELLLEHGANIEAGDARGWTPLFEACKANNDVAVKCLLDHHANANCTDLQNLTPIYIAAQQYNSNPEVVKLLLKYEVSVHCIDKQENSIIHRIVENCNARLIKSFAHTQVNFNSINKEGNTPLHIAVKNKYIDAVKILINNGADINVLDNINRTPLRIAINQIPILQRKLSSYRNSHYNRSIDLSRYVYSAGCYLRDIRTYKQIITILKTQVIKLKIIEFTVNNRHLNIVYHPNDYGNYEVFNRLEMDYKTDIYYILLLEMKCEQEIEMLKIENIGVKNITFYDFLKNSMHFLRRFVKNKEIQQTLELEVYDKKFPLYIDIIKNRFRDAKLLYIQMILAKKYFSINVYSRLSDDCMDAVFSYLNIKEIKMFLTAMRPVYK